MRQAIDKYKDLADQQKIRVELGSEGYPPDLETLVKGVALGGSGATGKNIRFLRRVPKDPMTGRIEWGMRSVQDDADSTSWGGKNVFDVYSKSTGLLWTDEVFRLVVCRAKVRHDGIFNSGLLGRRVRPSAGARAGLRLSS